jgi:hypothetical protein
LEDLMKRLFGCAGVALFAGVASLLAAASPARADSFVTQLGGVNLDAYCQRRGFIGATGNGNRPDSVTGWVCYLDTDLGPITQPIVSMDAPCSQQYSVATAAGFTVTAGCNTNVSVRRDLGGIATDAYCESLGYPSADIATDNITGWRCANPSGAEPVLNMDAACKWQYALVAPASTWTVFSVWGSFGDVFGISCVAIQLPTAAAPAPPHGGGCPRC